MVHVNRDAHAPRRIAVLTSGGDAQGMNAAVRAVVRTALTRGAEVFAIFEGYQGMIDGGDRIRRFTWDDVSGILSKGGTVIGTYRSMEFRERTGRLKAARNLLLQGIDRIVVIGGDGSLSGLDLFRQEWPGLVAELAETDQVPPELAAQHPALMIAGLVGSIDNDLVGTDMTIGADSALHRIVTAIDDLASTAASHQRSFVVEVMGRHCGYLALMSAIAGGCDYVLTPELPPEDGWEQRMCAELQRGRAAGRRDSIVIVAEGARSRAGEAITSEYVRKVIEDELGEDTRVTILGHVQRGGAPSAFDRWASTWLGYSAAEELLQATPESEGRVIGIRGNRMVGVNLMEAVRETREVATLVDEGRYTEAMRLRGSSFAEMTTIFRETAEPSRVDAPETAKRIGILHAGGLAPGMNAAARAAVRLGIARGHTMLGVRHGFHGLRDGEISELDWATVEGWIADGGAELGVRRSVPQLDWLYSISRSLEQHEVDALLIVGGWSAYQSAHVLLTERERYPAFALPMVCVPASIDNNLPGSELAIGADTALNVLVEAIDRVKLSGSATKRAFVVETMGRYCGYLALMSGIATGAERVYLHEDGVRIADLVADMEWLRGSFAAGRRLYLAVTNEYANENYDTDFIARLLREEGAGLFDVRTAVLGHIQQGGAPTPFDRLLATRLTSHAINLLGRELAVGASGAYYVGLQGTTVSESPLAHMMEHIDKDYRRPVDQWWMRLRTVAQAVSEEAR